MDRPILHLKKKPALLTVPTRPAAAPPPLLTVEEERAKAQLQRTRRLITAVEAHTGLPPETLGLRLLLPLHYRPDRETHAVLPTAAIQLWLEGRMGEAPFSAAEEQQVIARARACYGFADPAFVRAPREVPQRPPTPARNDLPGAPRGDQPTASRAQRWAKLAAEMNRSKLPLQLIQALVAVAPVSRQELAHLLQHGHLRSLQLTTSQETDLRGWLRLSAAKASAGYRSNKSRVNDFAKAAQRWERQMAKATA